jgi:hypothetical protein
MGTGRLFVPGALTSEIVAYIKEWVAKREEKQAL